MYYSCKQQLVESLTGFTSVASQIVLCLSLVATVYSLFVVRLFTLSSGLKLAAEGRNNGGTSSCQNGLLGGQFKVLLQFESLELK
jgi:hypothetical protein